jgi:hypothetical protein
MATVTVCAQLDLIPKDNEPPSLEQCIFAALKIGLPQMEAEKFWNFYEMRGWRWGKNQPIKKWRAALSNWRIEWEGRRSNTAPVPPHIQLRSVEQVIDRHPANRDSLYYSSNPTVAQKEELQRLKEKRDSLHRRIASI